MTYFRISTVAMINLSAQPNAAKSVIEAIQKSGLNVTPQSQGSIIYVPLPKITREHRENLAKNAKTLFNQCHDQLRALFKLYTKDIQTKGVVQNVAKDLIFQATHQADLLMKEAVKEAEHMMKTKQQELLEEVK